MIELRITGLIEPGEGQIAETGVPIAEPRLREG